MVSTDKNRSDLRTRPAVVVCMAILCSLLLLAGCAEDHRETETPRQRQETQAALETREIQEPEEVPVCEIGVVCTLKVYDGDMEPLGGIRFVVKDQDQELVQSVSIEDPADMRVLLLEEGAYQLTLIRMEDLTQLITFPIRVELGKPDTLSIHSDASGNLIPPVSPAEELQSRCEKIELGSEGPVEYTEEIWSRSDQSLNENNHWNAHVNCFYPVLSGIGPAEQINADLYRVAEGFMTAYTDEEIHAPHYAYGMPYAYSHQCYFDVAHNGDGLFSIRFRYYSFWGEEQSYSGMRGYVYSLSTGERLTLSQLTGIHEELLWQMEKQLIRKYLHNTLSWEETAAQVDALKPEDVGFFVQDGRIFLVIQIPKNDASSGGHGQIPTDWTI